MQQGHHDNTAGPQHGRRVSAQQQIEARHSKAGDGAWLSSGILLTCGALLPSLTLCASASKVRNVRVNIFAIIPI